MSQKAVGEHLNFPGRAIHSDWPKDSADTPDKLHGEGSLPGDFHISDLGHPGSMYLRYQCPCGCGYTRHIPIKQGAYQPGTEHWGWDGNLEKPTITPSIKHMDLCHFHGFLTAGQWTGQRE